MGFKKRKGIKIHVAVTSEDLPLSVVIGSVAESDPYRFEETLEAIKIRTGYKPITRLYEIVAGSIYDDAQVREYLRRRRIKIPIPGFSTKSYAKISAVERFFSKIEMGFRKILIRYESLYRIFRALVLIATFFI